MLLPYNFKKKGKNLVIRKVNDCTQEIRILFTKLRGTNSIDVKYNVAFSYPVINKIASYIQGIPYREKLPTGAFHFASDAPSDTAYSHVISDQMNEQDAIELAQKDAEVIIKFFLPLLAKCDSPESFISALQDEDRDVIKSLVGLGLNEWIQISALLSIGRIEKAVELFDNWTPVEWFGNQELSVDQKKVCRWRIATWNPENGLNDNYTLFGRQGNGTIVPVSDCHDI